MILTVCAGIFLVLVCLDMGVKQYIEDTFEEGEERKTCIPALVFRKVYNKGFAFNFMEAYPQVIRNGSVAAGIVIVIYDFILFFAKKKRVCKIAMTCITAGAFSNLYDRLIREKVIDYIGIRSNNPSLSRWTANLADLYIAAGAVIVTICRIFHKKERRNRKVKKAGE